MLNPVADDESVLSRPAPAPDFTVAYGDHQDQIAAVRTGNADRPLLVLLHGGFWRPRFGHAHTGPMAEALRAAGWTTASAEYRRVPGDPGVTASDVRAALGALPSLVTAHDGRMIVIGHSAGGQLALAVAAHDRSVYAVVAIAPVADLCRAEELGLGDGAVRAFLGGPATGHAGLDPMRLPSVPPEKVVLLHGRRDGTVPVGLSEAYAARHGAALVAPADAHHYSFIDPLGPHWPALTVTLSGLSRRA
ncbi:alpha/beta hydrolase family protein [Catenuloplanes atrovinosus]|uniref:Acetyl esterase/lipase n=1 Tax=Catenuloplanes atrovinosus TaxID=137266 RepID=A0AAE4C8J9_9ACTN|nr:alpha/beta hydrolase [Catenuloplanes atrovinosus]MDR7273869.1 acetyl esterase/lipase [Catenuloplanes atrovinosus]